jgi:hypothetical protein
MTDLPIMTNSQRALQLWSVLTLAGLTRTLLTYEELAKLTGLPNNSGNFLYYIYCYCRTQRLPLLSALVVNKRSGKPSTELYSDIDIPAEQRQCFRHDWLEVSAPTPEEFERAVNAVKGATP